MKVTVSEAKKPRESIREAFPVAKTSKAATPDCRRPCCSRWVRGTRSECWAGLRFPHPHFAVYRQRRDRHGRDRKHHLRFSNPSRSCFHSAPRSRQSADGGPPRRPPLPKSDALKVLDSAWLGGSVSKPNAPLRLSFWIGKLSGAIAGSALQCGMSFRVNLCRSRRQVRTPKTCECNL
jgi:hypothetical protein